MLDTGDLGLQQILVGIVKGKADKGELNKALAAAGTCSIVQDILRSMVFFQAEFWRPMITYVQNDRTTKQDTISVWQEYLEVLLKLEAWAESKLPIESMPWLDDDLDDGAGDGPRDFKVGAAVWFSKRGEELRTRGTVVGISPLTIQRTLYTKLAAGAKAEQEPEPQRKQVSYAVRLGYSRVQGGDCVKRIKGTGCTALLPVALSARVMAREKEREQTRIHATNLSGLSDKQAKKEASRRKRAATRIEEAMRARKSRREQQIVEVMRGDKDRLCTLFREQLAKILWSHEGIHSESKYDGLILRSAAASSSMTPEEATRRTMLIDAAKWIPSTSKLIEGFIGLFGYVREWSPNSTDQSTWNILAMREVGYTGMMMAIREYDEALFHRIMNHARAFTLVYVPRVEARKQAQKQARLEAYEADLVSGVSTQGARDLNCEARQRRAREWTHVSVPELKARILAAVQALHPQLSETKAPATWKKSIHQWIGKMLEVFRFVHGCAARKVKALGHVFYGKGKNGEKGGGANIAQGGTHSNLDGSKRTAYSVDEHIQHLWDCSHYVATKGSPSHFIGIIYAVGEQVGVQRDQRWYNGKIMCVVDYDNYRVAIFDPDWPGHLTMRSPAEGGAFIIESFRSCNIKQISQERRPQRNRRVPDRNALFNAASAKPGLAKHKR